MKILLVDDEKDFVRALRHRLEVEQYQVETAVDGETGLQKALTGHFDLILLDLMLPGLDGIEVCRRLRQVSQVPVIILTARDDDIDKIVGLEVGADDYITKPFNFRELQARIKAIMRRVRRDAGAASVVKQQQGPIVLGDLTIDIGRRLVFVNERPVELTAREFDLLLLLAQHPGHVFTREQLLDQIWGHDYYGSLRNVDVLVRRLREKLEDDPSQPRWICTRWGIGYYLAIPGESR